LEDGKEGRSLCLGMGFDDELSCGSCLSAGFDEEFSCSQWRAVAFWKQMDEISNEARMMMLRERRKLGMADGIFVGLLS